MFLNKMQKSQLFKSTETLQRESREELVRHILLLQDALLPDKARKKTRIQRPIDFSTYHFNWIALRIAYDGSGYRGMASQQGCSPHSTYRADGVRAE